MLAQINAEIEEAQMNEQAYELNFAQLNSELEEVDAEDKVSYFGNFMAQLGVEESDVLLA